MSGVPVVQGDMFSAIEGRFDTIVANPPWLFFFAPAKDERAWGTSKTYLPALFRDARRHLAESPEARIFAFYPVQFAGVLARAAAAQGFHIVAVHPHGERAAFSTRLRYFQVWFSPRWFELAPGPDTSS